MKIPSKRLVSVFVAASLVGLAAQAGEPEPPVLLEPAPQEDGWEFTLAPYLWVSGLEGKVGFNGMVADVDMSPSDILDALDIALMGSVEARKGRWGIIFDGLWLRLEDSGSLPGPDSAKVEVEVEEARLQALLSYRALDNGRTQIDFMAGVAWFYMALDMKVSGGPGASESADFFDPILGFSLRQQLSEKWFVGARGNIGGFGVSSDLVWQLGGMVGYQVNDCFAVAGGYRYLSMDYDDNDFVFDADTSGVFLGAIIEF